jgi:KipI family sensor histidine kinase inhibitor
MSTTIRRAGDAALLIETEAPHRLHAAVRALELPEIVALVPGARTLLVGVRPGTDLARVGPRIDGLALPDTAEAAGDPLCFPVVYDGADLDDVAALTGLRREEVVERHCAAEYVVAYLGFAPGFGYLTGLDAALHVPRRESPRTAVPAGSVAIAGPYGAVYPSRSPGGWRLLGRTTPRLWDTDRDPPSLLQPGTRVRFVPVEPGDDPAFERAADAAPTRPGHRPGAARPGTDSGAADSRGLAPGAGSGPPEPGRRPGPAERGGAAGRRHGAR